MRRASRVGGSGQSWSAFVRATPLAGLLLASALSCRSSSASPSNDLDAVANRASLTSAEAKPNDLVPTAKTEPSGAAITSRAVVHMAMVGDVSLSLHVKSYLEGKSSAVPPLEAGYPFGFVRERLQSYDLLVGNLECVVAERGESRRAIPLNAFLDTPRVLVEAGFDVVSVANNHALDLDFVGYEEMLKRLSAQRLDVAGDYLMHIKNTPFVVREVNGVRIAVIGSYNRDHDLGLRDVRLAKEKADVVLVFEHWGDDFVLTPNRFQRVLGRELIDAGASAVVGTHAHVVQPEELYRGKLIAHGLGNFVFSGMTREGTRTGALLELDIDKSGVIGHRYRRVTIDERGAPRFADGDATTDEPTLDPIGPRPMPGLLATDLAR